VSLVFSFTSVTLTPGISTALLRSRWVSSPMGSAAVSKYLASGQARTVVPCLRSPASSLRISSASITSPPLKASLAIEPSRWVVTSSRLDSALVTDTPTPCRPPEKL
jgi:hypothetical protein